jgi:hypothetical protein
VTWTPERFLIVDALLEDLRQRSSRVPIEQVALPGMDEGVPLRSGGAGGEAASGGVAFGLGGEEGEDAGGG